MPAIEPGRQFADFVLAETDRLRGGDRVPATVEEWATRKQEIRRRLLDSWGGFPPERCELLPQLLGTVDGGDFVVEKLLLQTFPGVWMTALAYVPKQRSGKIPAVLAVHGHWKQAKVEPVVQSRCIGLAKLGFFVLCVDAFGAGERAIGKALGEYHGEMVAATLLPAGYPLAGIQVFENMRAVDYLQSRPEVDGTKLGITGASGGGNQSMYAGAFDERFSAVVPTCSVGTYKAYLNTACCMCEVVPGAVSYTEEWGILSLVAPRGLMVISATKDAFQFSVGEAEKSLARAKQVYQLFGATSNLKHAVFDWHHDYSQAMREMMYGWMTRLLKGEGDGSPIADPAHEVFEPETLRCFPGETRPEDFVTLPQFAARLGRDQVDAANREPILHKEHWEATRRRLQLKLETRVLGNYVTRVPTDVVATREISGTSTEYDLRADEGIEITLRVVRPEGSPKGVTLLVDFGRAGATLAGDEALALLAAGQVVAAVEVRATGRYAWKSDAIGRAPDHNTGQWAVWLGTPLLGQWAFDLRVAAYHLHKLFPELGGVALVASGAACPAALCAVVSEPKFVSVRLQKGLASYVSDKPFVGQRFGSMAPGFLAEVGDLGKLAACVAPRRLEVVGAVTGGGEAVTQADLEAAYVTAREVYTLLGAPDALSLQA